MEDSTREKEKQQNMFGVISWFRKIEKCSLIYSDVKKKSCN